MYEGRIKRDLYTLLQILSLTLLERTEPLSALSTDRRTGDESPSANLLQLFGF